MLEGGQTYKETFMRYVFLILLAGCALTPEQRADRDLMRYGPYCERLGYQRGSEAFASCIQGQAMSRRQMNCQTFGNITTCQ